jgi:hypothetical protein
MSFTAEDARRLNDEYAASQQLSVNDILMKIEAASKLGKVALAVSLKKVDWSYRSRVYEKVKKELQSRGFKVKRQSWSDQRSGEDGDNITISW